ncbi:MAG: NTP transferase domain-containing protein [Armatimonadetes bacterium]|nr:NTP transferase domain-containing protein [Armatimonadota bacterium]
MRERESQPVAVIAAAGRGTRFRHETPKVLADVGGRSCLQRVIDAVEGGLGEHLQIIVVGHEAEQVIEAVGRASHRRFVRQHEPRGTGHALLTALAEVPADRNGGLYFFCGDKPLLRAETVRRFRERFASSSSAMLFLTGLIEGDDDAVRTNRQGRVVWTRHDGEAHALAIVERKVIDAIAESEIFRLYNGDVHRFSRDQLLAIREVNVSTYAWSLPALRRLVDELSDDNPQGEYLVTDLVQIFLRHHLPVQTIGLTDPAEGKGIDTVEQWLELAQV